MRGTPKNAVRFLGTPTRPCLDLRRCGQRATHASPLRSRFAVRLRGNLHVKSGELINEAPGGASSSRGTRRVNLLKPARGFYRALGEAGPISSPTRGKLLRLLDLLLLVGAFGPVQYPV